MPNINIEPLLKPISDSSPSGEESKYEFCYELMELEIKKFGSLFGEVVDWKIVETNAIEVLTVYSKDLKALCYLIRALIEDKGFVGLKDGLNLLKQYLTLFGSELYPRRNRARDGAIEWFVAQLESVLSKLNVEDINRDNLNLYIQLVNDINELYRDIYLDSEVDFYAITSVLNSLSERVSGSFEPPLEQTINKVDTEVAVSRPVVNQQKLMTEKKSVVAVKKEVDIDTDFSSPSASKRTLKKVAEFMMHTDIGTPLAYRLQRYCTWCEVDELPPHDNDSKTPLSLAVSQDQLSEYKDKAKKETESDVIKRLEKTLTDAPFWITGHYLMFQMLSNLNHTAAAEAVRQETQDFISRLEGIEYLTFANLTPFSDKETLKWLSIKTQNSRSISQSPVVYTESSDLVEGKISLETLGEYVSRISQHLAEDPSGRGQWMLHLKLVKAYQFIGLCPLCLPYIEKMQAMKEENNLMNWEPNLCSQLDSLVNQVLGDLYPSKESMPEKYQQWIEINNPN